MVIFRVKYIFDTSDLKYLYIGILVSICITDGT
jgi:hypothetical protein